MVAGRTVVSGAPSFLKCFGKRCAGSGEEVFVDRSGAKIAIQELYSRNSKGSLGLVIEQVTTRDESGALCTHGTRQLPNGNLAAEGPPTTLSDTGIDRMAFLQVWMHIGPDI
jgi:hypothetical protein